MSAIVIDDTPQRVELEDVKLTKTGVSLWTVTVNGKVRETGKPDRETAYDVPTSEVKATTARLIAQLEAGPST